MFVVQIYTWGGIGSLLEAIGITADKTHDKAERAKAKATIKEIKDRYGLTDSEIQVMSSKEESIGRLQAILVAEHNKVSGFTTKVSVLQQLMQMRDLLEGEKARTGLPFPTTAKQIDGKLKATMMAFSGLQTTRYLATIKIVLLQKREWNSVLELFEAYSERRLKGQVQLKVSSGTATSEQDEKSLPPMKMEGLLTLVANVDADGIFNMLMLLLKGKTSLADVGPYTTVWTATKSKLLLYICMITMFVILVFMFCRFEGLCRSPCQL